MAAENILKGETAGVPNVVLGVVVLAGLGYAWWRKRQNATADSGSAADASGVASDGSTNLQGQAPAEFLPTQMPTNTAGAAGTGFESNSAWLAAALNWVVANANKTNPPLNPVTAGTALGSYLAGGALSQTAMNTVNAVIVGIGPPPFPPEGNVIITPTPTPTAPPPVQPPPKSTPPPPAPKPAPAPSHTYYTVVKGDNLTTIGRKYGVSWQSIYNNNRNIIKNPNLIFPGQRLFIK